MITCIYRSGSPDKAKEKDDDLFKLIKLISDDKEHQVKVIAGDFNLNKVNWNPDPELPPSISETSQEYKFVELINDTYLYQHVSEPTRFGYREDETHTLDDLIFSTYETNISNLSYEPPVGESDHISLSCNIDVVLPTSPKPRKISYNYNKGDYEAMKSNFDIDYSCLDTMSVQEAADFIENIYHEAVNQHVPKITTNENMHNKPVWMSHETFRIMKRKHSSWVHYVNTKQRATYLEYTAKRNESTHHNRNTRRAFEKKLANECRKNPKAVYKYMKSSNRVNSSLPDLKKPDGTLTKSDEEAAEALNYQYYQTFTKENTEHLPTFTPKNLLTAPLDTFEIKEIDVLKELQHLQPNKSGGVDNIHPRVLKEMASQLAKPITILFNKSIEAGVLPKHWLQARITPIFKKGKKSLPENYRPVSLTCILCKVLEKIIVKQIINHIKSSNLDSKRQHGFTKGKSVTTNLLEMMNIWSEALMHNIPVDVLYLDYQKAFDTVPHIRLIKQLETFGIIGKASKWVEAFLSNREQKVMVNGSESSWLPVLSGIPQGSILGPVLFSIFVNDLPEFVSCIISLFADDTKISLPLTDADSTFMLQEDLFNLEEWATNMQMKFHPKKCKVLHLGKNNPADDYYMHNPDGSLHKLESPEVEKDLGVHTDVQLNFTKHIRNKINTANHTLRYIKHTFKYIDANIFLLLYKSMIRPHLEYCSCIWSPHLKYNIDAIERVQRRATKMVPSIKNLPYSQRLERLNLETLEYRRRRADLLETYRIMNGIHQIDQNCHCSKCPDKKMFMQPAQTVTTRGHSSKLRVQEATGIRRNFFASRVTKDWNNLSEKAISSKNIDIFKSNLKLELKNKFQFKFSY